MKKSSIFLIIGIVMLALAVGFVIYALLHPLSFFSIPTDITYLIYGIYIGVMILMFVLAVVLSKKM